MIDAPVGYGKTTLAAQWIAQLDRAVAWLALDEADDDPLRFCTCFVVVMQRVHPAIGDAGIADRLEVSVNTVRFHVKEICGKLGVNHTPRP